MGSKSAVAAGCALLACLATGCGSGWPSASSAPPATTAPAAAGVAAVAPAKADTPATPRCAPYPATTYGIDPNQLARTGGGAQLVTVVAASRSTRGGIFVAWARGAGGCWRPVSFAGQPGKPTQPFWGQTGYGGLLPFARRVPGDWATPTGLYPFGPVVYGNSDVSPATHYPYHHLVCGDWWDEQPGSPTYDTFQHVACGSTPSYGPDSEALWTEVQPYQHFIDIKMPDPPDNGAGIFLHDHMPEGYTEGCVALLPAELDAVLGWLNPADHPHILITVR